MGHIREGRGFGQEVREGGREGGKGYMWEDRFVCVQVDVSVLAM
jgi:hypothetical protein